MLSQPKLSNEYLSKELWCLKYAFRDQWTWIILYLSGIINSLFYFATTDLRMANHE